MPDRKEYSLNIRINGRELSRIFIDQHYKVKHLDVTDEIILSLVKQLDGRDFDIEDEDDEFQYFRVEPVYFEAAPYRLILLLCITDNFLGVVNAFRIKR
ncbi:MAG: hypothetical protein KDD38_02900 [Bdellovibrionales bacterium]|nr:hypothetical protein [Bdellovibrionales bacterium]